MLGCLDARMPLLQCLQYIWTKSTQRRLRHIGAKVCSIITIYDIIYIIIINCSIHINN